MSLESALHFLCKSFIPETPAGHGPARAPSESWETSLEPAVKATVQPSTPASGPEQWPWLGDRKPPLILSLYPITYKDIGEEELYSKWLFQEKILQRSDKKELSFLGRASWECKNQEWGAGWLDSLMRYFTCPHVFPKTKVSSFSHWSTTWWGLTLGQSKFKGQTQKEEKSGKSLTKSS